MNPAGSENTLNLGKQKRAVHLPSLDHRDVGGALAVIRDVDVWWAVQACIIFMALTCVRSREAREATWEEIDFETATWTIPATRMKNGVEHRVPLSAQAMEVLAYARAQGGGEGLIFPSRRGGKVIHPGALSKLFLELKIPSVPHGLRATFMNWAVERAHIAEPVAEMVLAHQTLSAEMRAFHRSELFERRVLVMQEWADFIAETMDLVAPADLDRR